MASKKGLSERQDRFVLAIASGSSIAQACAAVNVCPNTGSNWMKLPLVQMALADARLGQQQARVSSIREFQVERLRCTIPKISEQLDRAAVEAVDTYIEVMRNGKRDSDRIAAADRIVKLSGISEVQKTTQGHERSEEVRQGLTKEAADLIRRQILGIPAELDSSDDVI
jgi:hypothetical protein